MLKSITQVISRINTISSTSITKILLLKLTSGSFVDINFLVVEAVVVIAEVVVEIDIVVDFRFVNVVDVNVVVIGVVDAIFFLKRDRVMSKMRLQLCSIITYHFKIITS